MASKQQIKLDGWDLAFELVKKYLIVPGKIDILLSDLPEDISSTNRRICQFLFFGVIRHKRLLEESLGVLVKKRPKPGLWAVLLLGAFEILEADIERVPKIVDFVVNKAKKLSARESGLVNAVLRKIRAEMDRVEALGVKYSHPDWLVDSWLKEYGEEHVATLLEWNQQTPKVYIRTDCLVGGLKETKWDHFFEIEDWGVARELLKSGQAYIQDPSTRIAPGLSVIESDFHILDLCAAPGGKSLQLAGGLGKDGLIVACDLPGERIKRLKENLGKITNTESVVLESDVLDLSVEKFKETSLPVEYDVIFLDVPCSNTGVIQRRPDVKWRLEEKDILAMAGVQLELLKAAAPFVKVGGQLVYSTCSIERAENDQVIEQFLAADGGYRLEKGGVGCPWDTGHDGYGAFLLRRDS